MVRRTLARIRSLATLPLGEQALVIRAAAMASLLWLLLRILSLPRMLALIDPGVTAAAGAGQVPLERAVALVSELLGRRRHSLGPWQTGCLSRSLVLFRLLRQAGWPVVVCFGVAREGGAISGHCWLEQDGVAVAEEDDPRRAFRAIYSYPAGPSSQATA